MKRLILLEAALLFLATTFMSDAPPAGWYQQVLPVNKTINDIFFLDSLNGWIVASNTNYPNPDTGYVMRTTDGGNSWVIQLDSLFNYYAVQFLDNMNGYAAGGTGRAKFLKTTNGGSNWLVTTPFGSNMYAILDISFFDMQTGWICSDDSFGGGIYKTTNGGTNWQQQMSGSNFPKVLFFINKDTGWALSNEASSKLYRTLNGGTNWNLIFTFNTNPVSIYFINGIIGWVGGAGTGNGIQYTTNSGFNWINSQGYTGGGYDIKFVNDSIGYTGRVPQILKSTDGGKNWGYQQMNLNTYRSVAVIRDDTLLAWTGTFSLMHTTDGGGPINYLDIKQINSEIPADYKLFQNYPNPFNPVTNIKYEIVKNKYQSKALIQLKIFDITGKEILTLVNEEQSAGTYETEFDGSAYSSGVYLYQLTVSNGQLIYRETKRMILIK